MNKQTIEIKNISARLRDVIVGTCNTVGCKDCGLKWDGGCSASDLQDQLMELEMQEFKGND